MILTAVVVLLVILVLVCITVGVASLVAGASGAWASVVVFIGSAAVGAGATSVWRSQPGQGWQAIAVGVAVLLGCGWGV